MISISESPYPFGKCKNYFDDRRIISIEKLYDRPEQDWCVVFGNNLIFQDEDFSKIEEYLSKWNSVEELVGAYFIKNKSYY